jgi:3-hydroxyacyl-CoA dehydrogenase
MEIRAASVVGLGTMGAGIAEVLAEYAAAGLKFRG